jgi:hypothetical protein
MVPGSDLAVRRGSYKLVLDPVRDAARLFDLARDSAETTDVAGDHPELVQELRAELEHFRARRSAAAPTPPLTEEDLEKLEQLGYAGKEGE